MYVKKHWRWFKDKHNTTKPPNNRANKQNELKPTQKNIRLWRYDRQIESLRVLARPTSTQQLVSSSAKKRSHQSLELRRKQGVINTWQGVGDRTYPPAHGARRWFVETKTAS